MKIKRKIKHFSQQLITHRVKIAVVSCFLLLSAGGATTAWIAYGRWFSPLTVKAETTPALATPSYYSDQPLQVELKTWVEGSNTAEQSSLLVLLIDEAEVTTKELLLRTESQTIPLTHQLADLTEGEHQLSLALKNLGGEIVWQEAGKFFKDLTPPAIATSASTLSSTAKVTIATESGQVKVTDTKPVELALKLQFNEVGQLVVEPGEKVSLTWSQELTQYPTLTILAGQPTFTAPYTFTDQAGHQLKGELSYYYDSKPPTFNVTTPATATDKWGKGYTLIFTPSEPVSQVSVTLRGQALEANKAASAAHYFVKATLELGENVFTISGVDGSGNRGSQNFTVTVTHDSTPIFPTRSSTSFRPCTLAIRAQCRAQTGYDYGPDCDKFKAYVYCLRPLCDSTSGSVSCGDSQSL